MSRGYFEIGMYNPKFECNLGTLWRSAYILGANGIFTIGARYIPQRSDTCKTPRHIPLREYVDWDDFRRHTPLKAKLVAIEQGGRNLSTFTHPDRALYILGAEDVGLPNDIIEDCDFSVQIESSKEFSFNVSTAGTLVMYKRMFG